MSILSIFKSGLFRSRGISTSPKIKTVEKSPEEISLVKGRDGEAERDLKQSYPSQPQAPTVDTAAIIAQAQATAQQQAREIILAAKDEAFKLKDQAIKDARIQLEEIELRSKSIAQKQQAIITSEEQIRKEKLVIEATQKQTEKT